MDKPIIEYPCLWNYKLVGKDADEIQEVAKKLVRTEYTLAPSKTSKQKKYLSFNLELTVETEEQRNELYQSLKADPKIVMVL